MVKLEKTKIQSLINLMMNYDKVLFNTRLLFLDVPKSYKIGAKFLYNKIKACDTNLEKFMILNKNNLAMRVFTRCEEEEKEAGEKLDIKKLIEECRKKRIVLYLVYDRIYLDKKYKSVLRHKELLSQLEFIRYYNEPKIIQDVYFKGAKIVPLGVNEVLSNSVGNLAIKYHTLKESDLKDMTKTYEDRRKKALTFYQNRLMIHECFLGCVNSEIVDSLIKKDLFLIKKLI